MRGIDRGKDMTRKKSRQPHHENPPDNPVQLTGHLAPRSVFSCFLRGPDTKPSPGDRHKG